MDSAEHIEPEEPPPEAEKRRRGRPKGTPKTGGRQKREWTPQELRSVIFAELDGIEGLIDIARRRQLRLTGSTGKTFLGYPTVDQTLKAWELLLRKCLPDLAQTQITGDNGGAIQVEADISTRDLARSVLDVLRSARLDPAPADLDLEATEHEALAVGGASWGGNDPLSPTAEGVDAPSAGPSWAGVYPTSQMPAQRTHFEPGERILVAGATGWLEVAQLDATGERARFWLCNRDGAHLAQIWGEAEAKAKLMEFTKTGQISR